jgi:hypothetical protein
MAILERELNWRHQGCPGYGCRFEEAWDIGVTSKDVPVTKDLTAYKVKTVT